MKEQILDVLISERNELLERASKLDNNIELILVCDDLLKIIEWIRKL